jgi:hypothetical protein
MLRPSSTLPSRSETSCLLGEAPQTRHWVWRSFFRIGCRSRRSQPTMAPRHSRGSEWDGRAEPGQISVSEPPRTVEPRVTRCSGDLLAR